VKGWDLSSLLKIYGGIHVTWLLLESRCWYLYQTKVGWTDSC